MNASTDTLGDVRAAIYDLAGVIGAPSLLLPTFGRTEDLARPHIEHTPHGFEWVVVERGQELERRLAVDRDELLYWTFRSVTFSMATSWEVAHRVPDQDSRIGWVLKQIELLERLSSRWADRYRTEQSWLLRQLGLT